jgi:membrane associated rhomboid family serine protease
MLKSARVWLAPVCGLSIVIVWLLVFRLHDGPLAPADLVVWGAIKGRHLPLDEPWRLLAAQWLHTDPVRMLFNVAMISLLGTALARKTSALAILFIGLMGGAAGLFGASIIYPEVVIFGATQALLAICGAVVLLFTRQQFVWWIAIQTIFGSLAFDLLAGGQGAFQPGFDLGFAVGAVLLMAGAVSHT